jgi:Toxin SymE, type I toxin-antitoxin system
MAIAEFTPSPLPSSGAPAPANSVPPASMTSRRLTVGSGNSGSRGLQPVSVPFLRLQGRWLGQAGFEIGANVRVLVTPGCLVLEVVENERVVNACGASPREANVDSLRTQNSSSDHG